MLLERLEHRLDRQVEAVAEPGQVGGAADHDPLVERSSDIASTRAAAITAIWARSSRLDLLGQQSPSACGGVGDPLAHDRGAGSATRRSASVSVRELARAARRRAARPGRWRGSARAAAACGLSDTSSTWRTVERASVGYCTIATCWVSWASSRTERWITSSRSCAPSRKRGDRAALGRGQRLDLGEPVDEEAVALVGGDAPGAGVRLGDQPLLLERGHVVADRGGRDTQAVPLDEGLAADRLAGGDVVLDDRAEHGEPAVLLHVASSAVVGLLALACPECQGY